MRSVLVLLFKMNKVFGSFLSHHIIFTFKRLTTFVNVNQTLPSSLLFSYWWLSIKHDITETTSPPTHESSARVSRQIGGKHVAVPVYVKLFRIILDVVSGVFWKITSAAWNKNNIYGGGWLVVASWLAPPAAEYAWPADRYGLRSVCLSICGGGASVHHCTYCIQSQCTPSTL